MVSMHKVQRTGLIPIECDPEVVEVISQVRQVVNQTPCLRASEPHETEPTSERAGKERKRWSLQRGMYEKLSLYYRRPMGSRWTRVKLLSTGEHRCI